MNTQEFLKILVDEIHSVVIATVDQDGKPVTRVIDMMYQDGETVYFLTANTKAFYLQLREKPFLSLTGMTQGKDSMHRKSISFTGRIKHIGKEKLDILLENNPYMYDIYPTEEARQVLEVFKFESAEGEFYDLTVLPPQSFPIQIGR